MRFKAALIIVALLWTPASFAAAPDGCIAASIPHAKEVGHGRMPFLAWDLYDASLYAPAGKYKDGKPFALTLTYLHGFKGGRLADEASSEMNRLGLPDDDKSRTWNVLMHDIFPDVSAGDEITGIYTSKKQTIFCEHGRALGVIKESDFGPHFFGIWLDERAMSPALRNQLLGDDNEETHDSGGRHGP